VAFAAASRADLAVVRAHVEAACLAAGADAEARDALVLAADEVCANVLLHAYAGRPGPLTVDVQAGPAPAGSVHVTVMDAGPPFDPGAHAPAGAVPAAPAEARRIGGLGLLLVRQSVDALGHERAAGVNVVTLGRRLRAAGAGRPA
jgi:serine/threonine-protein kinase RsbW/sigma-B regulation protein RsbU (phosphoserine phosphatase)